MPQAGCYYYLCYQSQLSYSIAYLVCPVEDMRFRQVCEVESLRREKSDTFIVNLFDSGCSWILG